MKQILLSLAIGLLVNVCLADRPNIIFIFSMIMLAMRSQLMGQR